MERQALEFLKALVDTPSPSGFEQAAQKVVGERMANFADKVKKDVHGNCIGILNPRGKPRVMLAGHCDEVGFMVKYISDDGYLYFAAIGGVEATIVPAQRVVVHSRKGPVPGVVGKRPIHLSEKEERQKSPKMHQLWIDIGARNRRDAERSVEIGDPITFAAGFQELKNGYAAARGFDDKMGSFVVVETLRRLSRGKINASLFAVSTVQEEVGLRGARTSAFGIAPDVGIAVDVDYASDHPDVDKKRVGEQRLGKGPVLHRGANINPRLGEMIIQTARREKIPHQLCGSPRATGTDANVMQLNRSGAAAALVSVPCRYLHTPGEVMCLADIDNAVKLLVAFLRRLPRKVDFTP